MVEDGMHRLLHTYVSQATTHGVRKITSSRHPARRLFWTSVFLLSLSGCTYHCSYLIRNFASYPKATVTQEKDADAVEFPALTVCNLNVIKKEYASKYFTMASHHSDENMSSSVCAQSEEELLEESAVDLSDTWLNLGVTKDNLSEFGHKAEDLVIQCTYNSKDCDLRNNSFTVNVSSITSPIFGLCHTFSVKNKGNKLPTRVKRGGTTYGIRLTLNIEKNDYWDLISPEYGVRLLVHPQGTYPTLQRGGIIGSPGRSIHIGIKRRVTTLLPGHEGSCSESFESSQLIPKLKASHLEFDVTDIKYTYEYCNTLCMSYLLVEKCKCVDEAPKVVHGQKSWKFCNPCNKTEAKCRSGVLKNFTESGNVCDDVCKPSCNSIRYDISLSKADWPNLNHQLFVLNRSAEKWMKHPEILSLLNEYAQDDGNASAAYRFIRQNMLRVHLFVEEMIYMSIEESYNYPLPKLLADLGGCLGLYLGVSVISIIEIIDLWGSATLLCFFRRRKDHQQSRTATSRKQRRNKIRSSNEAPTFNGGKKGRVGRQRSENIWRNSSFNQRDPYFYEDITAGKHVLRRF